MSLTGLKFLGCTVKNFSTNIGLENQKTSVKISLVEDRHLGDLFIPNKQGTPLSVEFGALRFTGLLQNYTRSGGADGLYTYEATLEDPRDILEGTTLILGDFEGATSVVPNLLNIYGYYESTGFNASLANSAGMSWNMIKPAIEAMTLNQTSFGGPLNYKGYSYSVDLSGLPVPASSYRVGGTSISLLQIISEVCHDAACDFFVEFEYGTRKIKVRTISRRLQPKPGLLSAYIAAQTASGNCIKSNVGVEARNETCSHFLTGGQVTDVYQSGEAYQYFGQDVNNLPILAYRTDPDDVWTVTGDLNSLEISDITGATTYSANMLEMACAEFSQELWMAYVSSNKAALAALLGIDGLVLDPALLGFAPGRIAQANVGLFNMKGLQAANLNAGLLDQAFMWRIARVHSFVKKAYDQHLGKTFLIPTRFVNASIEAETNQIVKSHDFASLGYSINTPLGLSSTYNSFFGPSNGQFQAYCRYDPSALFQTGVDQGTFLLDFTLGQTRAHPTYTPVVPAAVDMNFRVLDVSDFVADLGLGESYGFTALYKLPASDKVADNGFFSLVTYNFDRADEKDAQIVIGLEMWSTWQPFWARLNPDDLAERTFAHRRFEIEKINGDYYVRLQVILDNNQFAPGADFHSKMGFKLETTAVVTRLTGLFDLSRLSTESYVFDESSFGVYVKCTVSENLYPLSTSLNLVGLPGVQYGALVTVDNPIHIAPTVSTGAELAQILTIFNIPDNVANRAAWNAMTQRYAAGTCVQKVRNMAIQPIAFAIPIQDNLNTYGPWYAVGALGKVQYEKDTTLNPWDCGGEANMNALAGAKVSQSLSFQQSQETGSFELVGVPAFNIGDAISTGGPNITNMDVGYSERGVTTTYRFHTFSNRFGVVNKSAIEQNRRTTRGIIDAQKKIRQLGELNLKKISGANNANRQLVSTFLVNQFAPGFAGRSSNNIITFYCDDWTADDEVTTGKVISGGIVPMIEGPITWRAADNDDFVKTASMSLDGLLRPFSTHFYDRLTETLDDVDAMATYVKANTNYASNSTVTFLNPFQAENDVQVLIQGDDSADLDGNNFLNDSPVDGDQRVIGLKGPIVISSFGWSVDDAPVPNASPADLSSSSFEDNYLRNGQLWPTGPLEILWDGERGVWTSMGHCMGTTQSSIASGSTGLINLWKGFNSVITGRLKDRTVMNITNKTIASGTAVVCVWIPENKKWCIVSENQASYSVSGVVSTGSQVLGGRKYIVGDELALTTDTSANASTSTHAAPWVSFYIDGVNRPSIFAASSGSYSNIILGDTSTEPNINIYAYSSTSPTHYVALALTYTSSTSVALLVGYPGTTPAYAITNSAGTVLIGQSITRNGLTFVGGILTSTAQEYTVANSAHWDGADPTTFASALDRLAAAIFNGISGVAVP